MTKKTADYWAGYDSEAARIGRNHFTDLARQVTQALGRDNAGKQRIFARSPGIFSGMDAEEFGRASSRELAVRELRELGIDIGKDDDPEKMLDMHHAGRQWARDRTPGSGGPILGGKPADIFNPLGSASDSREGATSVIERYIRGD